MSPAKCRSTKNTPHAMSQKPNPIGVFHEYQFFIESVWQS